MSETKEAATVHIESVNQFVGILQGWHDKKVKVLEHMLTVPEGTEMQVAGESAAVLTGDMLAGFKAGIQLSLMELGKLPFAVEFEEAPAAAADVPQ